MVAGREEVAQRELDLREAAVGFGHQPPRAKLLRDELGRAHLALGGLVLALGQQAVTDLQCQMALGQPIAQGP